ncbi:MAG: hypothetical protein ACI831_000867 [Candidatus Azotimanducaceae bacterium]|jgi:hypothetical protein
MNKQQPAENQAIVIAAVQPTLAKRVADMIENPIGSVIIATTITTLAISAVLAGMGIVNLILY